MGELEKRGGVWRNSLNEGLGGVVGGEEWRDVGKSKGDGNEGFVHGEGKGCDFVFLCQIVVSVLCIPKSIWAY